MRILYASMMLPCPPTFGKRMEIWTTLRALSAAGHDVTLVSFHDPVQDDVDTSALSTVCRDVFLVPLQLFRPRSLRDYGSRLAALFHTRPHQAARYLSSAFTECIEQRLGAARYDAVICGEVFVLQNMPSGFGVPLVLKKDHLAATILRRYAASEHNPLKKFYGWVEWTKMRRWETNLCRRSAAIIACSDLERAQLQTACPSIPVTMGPNVLDLDTYTTEHNEDDTAILYHGLMDWFPNQDAVTWFISEILPRLRGFVPNVRLVVAGRSSSQQFSRRFANVRGVDFVGTVPDMHVYIRRCAVCIVPLRIASGTRFKILEAAALGKPVVSTRIGAEGLSFTNGSEILLADTPDAFARCVAELLENPRRRLAMGLAARRRVEADYSFSKLGRALEETLALVVPPRVQAEATKLPHPSP